MRFTKALAAISLFAAQQAIAGDTSDSKRTFQEICVENGFLFEEHTVTTEDGYILTVFRIPGLDNETPSDTKPPVFMQHGVFDSANCWIVNYAEVAPAFVAARAGYDVWLGNSRGNTYSRAHTTYDPDKNEKKFWSFSWYEMGLYDIPAVFDHIRLQTNDQKIAYIGHSQGTTQMFVGLAENEKTYFADKTSIFIGLGPVAKIPNTQSGLLQFIVDFYDTVANTCDLFGIHELLGANWFTSSVTQLFCSNIPEFCELLLAFFTSNDPALDDNDRYAVYMGHEPNGSSVQALLHYAQNMREDRFQVWADDYTDIFHRKEKRQTDLIPIETITEVPVALFAGTSDILADTTDAEWIRDTIGSNVVHYEEIAAGHLTFLVGKDMSYFTDSVMNLLYQYQPLPTAQKAEEFLQ